MDKSPRLANDRLDAWMTLEGYDYKELAERLGFDASYVWYIRAGQRAVTESFRWRFAAEFGFDLATKLFGESTPKAAAPRRLASVYGE